jgi:hypothetical protein
MSSSTRRDVAARRTPLRIAQVVAAGNHSPWFADIGGELVRRGFHVHAIIDSTPGNLGERLTRAGISFDRVPMVLAPGLDRARLPF